MRPGLIPHLFDKPEFFDKIAERSQLTGQSPDLLFFAFYYQPVSLLFPLPFLTHHDPSDHSILSNNQSDQMLYHEGMRVSLRKLLSRLAAPTNS